MAEFDREESREVYWHTSSHLMAHAIMELYPGTRLAIGPAIKEGFYYDIEAPRRLTPEDLPLIEERMHEIAARDLELTRLEVPREEAIDIFKKTGQPYKVELLEEIIDTTVSLYRQGDFVDLCRGPHLLSTGEVKVMKLLSLAGAYWRGNEKGPMLQRIYGISFAEEAELAEFIFLREEAERRDHRRLGKELDLFSFHDEAGPGVVFYHPKGAILRGVVEDFLKEQHRRRGYLEVITPHLYKGELWHVSGHLDYYQENMYTFDKEGSEYVVKPMNCPGHLLIYKTRPRSYRDMPLKYFELGTVYRYERSGVLHGLMRVRGFTQDDAHIFCTEDQLEEQIFDCLDFAFKSLRAFGFSEFEVNLSTKPEKAVGSDQIWDKATLALQQALGGHAIDYRVDPGEGVFYGPKIDVKLKDAIGRLWQGPTIQADFNLPERFGITYAGQDNQPHQPVMIHRVVLAGIERFLGILIEHYGGAFPLWLAPVQVTIIPIADRHLDYALRLKLACEERGIRVEVDDEHQTLNAKIRRAQLQKVPFMAIIGDKEVEAETLSIRTRAGEDLRGLAMEEFVARAAVKAASRDNDEGL
jgi:threonyl-tRNA synthetase